MSCYQYKVVPFGMTTSPRVFTKVLAPLMGGLRLHGVQAFPYLHDILLTAESRLVLEDMSRKLKPFYLRRDSLSISKSLLPFHLTHDISRSQVQGKVVLVRLDNTTTCTYITG